MPTVKFSDATMSVRRGTTRAPKNRLKPGPGEKALLESDSSSLTRRSRQSSQAKSKKG